MFKGAVLIGCGFALSQIETHWAFSQRFVKNCQIVRTTSLNEQVPINLALATYIRIAQKYGWAEPSGGLAVVQFTTRSGQRVWSIYPLG